MYTYQILYDVTIASFSAIMKEDVPGMYVQTVERLVDWGLTSHQQLRSYGDGTSVYSPIRRTGEPATPGLQGEWHNHCTTKASQTVEKRNSAVMFATLRKQQSASTAVAYTQLFHMTVRLGTTKSSSLR